MEAPSNYPNFPPGYFEEDRGGPTKRTAIAFMVLEIVIVTMRLASRRLIGARLALDDLLIFPSLIFCLGLCVLAIGMYRT